MKKINIIALTLLFVAGLVIYVNAGPYPPRSHSVTTNSTVIIAPAKATGKPWATNTVYTQGKVILGTVTNGPHWYYWALVAGTSATNRPNWKANDDVTDGTVTWRPVVDRRSRLYIQNPSTNTVYLGFDGEDAVAGSGVYLTQDGSLSYNMQAYQGQVTAVVSGDTSSTGTVTTQQIP